MQKQATGQLNTTLAIIPIKPFFFPREFALKLNPVLIQYFKKAYQLYDAQSAFMIPIA
jgi:hypothetical protein